MLLFVGFTIAHRRRSGIHRVIVETARALSDLVALDLVRWDVSAGALRFLDVGEIDALFGPGDWPAGVRVRSTARRVGGSFWSDLGDLAGVWLLAPEVAWHEADGNRVLAEVLRQCRHSGVRTAALCYDLIPIRNPVYREGAALHQAYLRELAGCDLVLPISRDCGAQLVEWWREQGVSSPPATEPLLLPDGGFGRRASDLGVEFPSSDSPQIVLLGTVEPRKRQLFFLEAMRRARGESAEVARYQAVVVGSLQPRIADAFKVFLAANPWVRFLDYASDAEVARLLRGARFTVFASDDEGYGLPIAESLAAGTPCLCADFGAMGEIAQGGGCLTVDVRDEARLGDALVRLCENPAELVRLRAEIALRPFRSWRDYAEAMLARMATHTGSTASPPKAAAGPVDADDRIVSAPWRLALAVRRNGLGEVLRFLARTLRRRGARGAVSLVFAGRARRARLAEGSAAGPHKSRPTPLGPPDLDEDYAMSAAAWALRAVQAQGQADGRTDEVSADVDFVVAGTAEPPGVRPSDRWVVFLRPGDRPGPHFLGELTRATRDGLADVVSFDMIRRTDAGDIQPLSAPGANPTLYRAIDHLFGRIALRARLLSDERAGAGTDPRAVVLYWLDRTPSDQVRGRWRHLGRAVVEVAVTDGEIAAGRPPARSGSGGHVRSVAATTIVIAMPAQASLPERLLVDLLRRSEQTVAKVVLVADDADDGALAILEARYGDPRLSALRCDGQREHAHLYNAGAALAGGEGAVLFMDAAVTPVGEAWLERLAARLQASPEVGAVGPLLRDPQGRVSSAGLHLRPGASVGRTLSGLPPGDAGYLYLLAAPRETTGLSGAALMTRRQVFDALGGFDAQLGTGFYDIDYGRRVVASGWTNVFEPAVVLTEGERSGRASAGAAIRREARDGYDARWRDGDESGRLYPAAFDLRDDTLRRLSVLWP